MSVSFLQPSQLGITLMDKEGSENILSQMESLIVWKAKRKKALQWVMDNLAIKFHRNRVRRKITWKNDRGRSSCLLQ